MLEEIGVHFFALLDIVQNVPKQRTVKKPDVKAGASFLIDAADNADPFIRRHVREK
nr:hypothetical protein [Candidatus Sigynarchaeota archaeon]